jgi:hypothetical protein
MFLKINATDKINASGKVEETEMIALRFRAVTVHGLILEFRYSLSFKEHSLSITAVNKVYSRLYRRCSHTG